MSTSTTIAPINIPMTSVRYGESVPRNAVVALAVVLAKSVGKVGIIRGVSRG